MRAGLDNAFGHPHDQVVDGLEAAGAVVGEGGSATPTATKTPTKTPTATTTPTGTASPTSTATATSSVSGTGDVRITNILYDSPVSGETSGEYVWVSTSTEEAL